MEKYRICRRCNFFDTSSYKMKVFRGRCLLFDSVNPLKRNSHYNLTHQENICRFGIPLSQLISTLTAEQTAEFANKCPGIFLEKIEPKDIDVKVLKYMLDI